MKIDKKLFARIFIWLFIIYAAMLFLLLGAERAYGGSPIHSVGSAIWYSVVTLSTVGYGDLVPVSPLGRIIGIGFLLLSMGVLATIFGTVLSFVTGEAFPLIRLSFKKEQDWYYFADFGEESSMLASNIIKEDPQAVIIFGEKMDAQDELPDYPCFFIDVSPSVVVARKKGRGSRCKVFFMKENDIGSNVRGLDIYELPVDVYARTTNGIDSLSGNIRFFHSYDCCARQYWQKRPIHFDEKSIVIIGFGNYGKSILERAILTNVWSDTQHVTYHIFGDYKEFLEIHYCLDKMFSINEVSDERDSLIFHDEGWTSHHEILESADRIIVCDDDMQKGWNIYWNLRNYYRLKDRVDLRNDRKSPGVSYFGTFDEIYTPRQIMRTQLNRAAIITNELFRKTVNYPTVGWEELDDFHRASKIAAADHMLMKMRILLGDTNLSRLSHDDLEKAYLRYDELIKNDENLEMCRKIEHLRWCRFYFYYNWSYGTVRNDKERKHPMLVPFNELTSEQKLERDQAWQLMESLSSQIGNDDE